MSARISKIGIFQIITVALLLLALLLSAVSLLMPDPQPSSAGQVPTPEMRGSEDPNAAEIVKTGLNIQTLGPVDTEAETFFARFDLWLVGRQLPDPAKLVFLHAASPIRLGEPVSTRITDQQQYRLYQVEGTFRYHATVTDIIAGRFRLDLSLVDTASSASQLLFAPDRERSTLIPAGGDQHPRTTDGAWTIDRATLDARRVVLPTSGDPLFPAALESRPELVASFFLLRSSPGIGELAQRLVPRTLAVPLTLGMLCLLAAMPALARLDRKPRPWRMLATLSALTLLLAAAGKVFADHLPPGIDPGSARIVLACLAFGWLALAAAWLIGSLPVVLWRPLERRTGTPVSLLERTIVNVAIVLAFLLYFLAHTLDLSAATLGAASGVLTVVLGIALQSIILDLFSGILLNMEKPFRLLHWVTINHNGELIHHGQVRDMNWRTTQLQTRDNDIMSIPNSIVANSTISNHAIPTAASRFRLEFVLDPRVPTQRARGVMREAALHSGKAGLIQEQPPPSVSVVGPEDYGIRYRVFFYVNLNITPDGVAVSSVAENILDALAAERIELAFRFPTDVSLPGPVEGGVEDLGPALPPPAERAVPHRSDASGSGAGLSDDDIARIRASWAPVASLGGQAAILFYDRLFEIAPSLKPLFRSDPRTQRIKFVAMLTMLVKGLDNPEILMETLADLGLRHHTYNVQPKHYDVVREALLWTLEQALGKDFDEAARAAWSRLYGVVASTMIDASGRVAA